MTPLRRRKRTACWQCGSWGRFECLELMWRSGGSGPWHWVVTWPCAACRSAGRELFGQLELFHELVEDW